jgi:hypothetical protein
VREYPVFLSSLALLSSALNYFQCRQILETLKTVDGDSKTIFGKYISARVQVVCILWYVWPQ